MGPPPPDNEKDACASRTSPKQKKRKEKITHRYKRLASPKSMPNVELVTHEPGNVAYQQLEQLLKENHDSLEIQEERTAVRIRSY